MLRMTVVSGVPCPTLRSRSPRWSSTDGSAGGSPTGEAHGRPGAALAAQRSAGLGLRGRGFPFRAHGEREATRGTPRQQHAVAVVWASLVRAGLRRTSRASTTACRLAGADLPRLPACYRLLVVLGRHPTLYPLSRARGHGSYQRAAALLLSPSSRRSLLCLVFSFACPCRLVRVPSRLRSRARRRPARQRDLGHVAATAGAVAPPRGEPPLRGAKASPPYVDQRSGVRGGGRRVAGQRAPVAAHSCSKRVTRPVAPARASHPSRPMRWRSGRAACKRNHCSRAADAKRGPLLGIHARRPARLRRERFPSRSALRRHGPARACA